uniref:Uncharacterized protein n=1 Tax=Timema monikensis TaxID=170555 RepID=A0A7R9EF79_9NEOP|nr:unnamed protein product [Timema monikensis]
MSASAPVHHRVGGGTMLIKSVSIFLASGRKASVAGKSRTTAAGVGDGSTSGGGKRKGGKARRMMGDDTTKMSTVTKCSSKMIESLKKRTHFTRYMALVAKYTGGKCVNYTLRGSYRRRCYGAALAHTSGPSWHLSPWKHVSGKSPGKVFKRTLALREKASSARHLNFTTTGQMKRSRTQRGGGPDIEYGPEAVQPDLSENELGSKMQDFVNTLREEVESIEKQHELERSTVGQHNNAKCLPHYILFLSAVSYQSASKKPSGYCSYVRQQRNTFRELRGPLRGWRAQNDDHLFLVQLGGEVGGQPNHTVSDEIQTSVQLAIVVMSVSGVS